MGFNGDYLGFEWELLKPCHFCPQKWCLMMDFAMRNGGLNVVRHEHITAQHNNQCAPMWDTNIRGTGLFVLGDEHFLIISY